MTTASTLARALRTGALSLAVASLLGAGPALALDKVRAGTSGLALLWSFIEAGSKVGTWQKYGIEVERLEFAGDAVTQQALTAGSVQFGFGSGPGMAYHSKGVPAIAVAAVAGPPFSFALIVGPNSRIKTVADLKDAKIGVTTAGSVTQWLARELSRKQGWGPTGITDMPLGSVRTQLVAVKSGEIDGSVTTAESAYFYEAQKEARTLLLFGDIVTDFHTHVILASTDLIAKNPDLVTRFLKGWFATVAYMKANRAYAVKEAAAAMRYPESIIDRAMDAQFKMLSDDGAWNQAAITKVSSSLVELGIVEKEPPRNMLYNDKFVPVQP
ncbi:MAG: ABC-type nitrate/sulfonate/bicarbonate transport system, substrate-binding protein [Hyphomicrobiales bacterium]|nr:ABC-type nitrate/sulfonate/bicarbonate transport system, substrate-binding protein [Hyphomicrobiales bacterium]